MWDVVVGAHVVVVVDVAEVDVRRVGVDRRTPVVVRDSKGSPPKSEKGPPSRSMAAFIASRSYVRSTLPASRCGFW